MRRRFAVLRIPNDGCALWPLDCVGTGSIIEGFDGAGRAASNRKQVSGKLYAASPFFFRRRSLSIAARRVRFMRVRCPDP